MAGLIDARRISHSFGRRRALEDVSFRVERGVCHGVLGANGAGKTSLLSILIGALHPTEGDISFPSGERPRIGFVSSENVNLEPLWRVGEYLRFITRLHSVADHAARAVAHPTLEKLRLSEVVSARISRLSSGNRRKVEIARALLSRAELLILDEPMKELDMDSRASTWEALLEFQHAGGSIVYSSHEPSDFYGRCDLLTVLHGGRIVWRGRKADLPPDRDAFDAFLLAASRGDVPGRSTRFETVQRPEVTGTR